MTSVQWALDGRDATVLMSASTEGTTLALFGAPPRLPRPVLLIIVFGIFLAIVGVTAMAQTIMVSAQFSTSAINNVVGSDTALVRLFVTGALSPDDLGTGRTRSRTSARP